ncbi:MAG TPA: serine/threonine-protein kinase [Polyangiaceae bacterium]
MSTGGTPTIPAHAGPGIVGLPPGTLVGRYVVVQPIGEGAMGAVMLAYDTKLARSVALKLLRVEADSEEARVRMTREAQAMAQLSHPNVAAVYDVGTHEGNVYLTMEYLDGETMKSWLREPRSWREVLSVMLQAGRGLEAAHARGIVHRDFKPANVLITKEGRVCVLDFGIARSERAPRDGVPPAASPSPPSAGSAPSALAEDLTEEGAIVGTPGYFAPETAFDRIADARSDEFSFCVTFWRALYGTPPYPSKTVHEYVTALPGGPGPRPKTPRVPAWLHTVVRKGLDPEPERRFRSMGEVLRALDDNPSRRRLSRAAVVAAIGIAALAAVAVGEHRRAVRSACDAEGAAIGSSWGAVRRAALQDAIAGAGDPNAADRAERTGRALDAFVDEWRGEQRSSCLATRAEGTQTRATYEVRTACLLGARQQFEAVIDLLASRDASILRRETEMAKSLPPPALCKGPDAATAFVPLPADPQARAKAQDARRLLERARALQASGPSADGLKAAEGAVALAREAGDGADEASALLVASLVHARRFEDAPSLQTASDALFAAERAGVDHVAGLSAVQRAFLLAERFKQVDAARAWLDLARAKLERHTGDEALELEILKVQNTVSAAAGDSKGALEGDRRYVDLVARRYGRTNLRTCKAVGNVGQKLFNVGDYEGAADAFRDTLSCTENEVGPGDESLALGYNAYAATLDVLGRLDDAIAAYRRALDLRRAVGPSDGLQVVILSNLSETENRAGHAADAEQDARRALPLAEASTGYAHAVVPRALFALGAARLAQGHPEEAVDACSRAIVSGAGDDTAAAKSDDYDSLRCLGEAELALGKTTLARGHLERAVAVTKSSYVDDLPRARFALARALATGTPADRSRARDLARSARDELSAAVGKQPWLQPTLQAVERWIANPGGAAPGPRNSPRR